MAQRFEVSTDPDYGFIVCQRQTAVSFATIPNGYGSWSFEKKAEAVSFAESLNGRIAKGETIKTSTIETPERFEAVADSKYGPAWD
jgi:hypothetical protein